MRLVSNTLDPMDAEDVQINPSSDITSQLWDGNWHHIAFTISRTGNGIFYLDGVPKGNTSTSTVGNLDNNLPLFIAASRDVGGAPPNLYFGGLIDDVRIYNRALSATEITALYNSTCYEGDMMYNSDYNVMQYCNGTSWVRIGQ